MLTRPDLAATLRPLVRHYARMRYGTSYNSAQLQRFRRAVKLFTLGHAPEQRRAEHEEQHQREN